jgi:hypothetical protein
MNHLTDEQLTEWLAGETNQQTQLHLADCAQCRAEAFELRSVISRYSIAMRWLADGARSAPVTENFAFRRVLARHRPRWAAATMLALLLAAPATWMWMKMPRTPLVNLQPIATAHSNLQPAASMSDDELLEAVNNDLNREVPQALSPVSAITMARNRIAVSAAGDSSHKQGATR